MDGERRYVPAKSSLEQPQVRQLYLERLGQILRALRIGDIGWRVLGRQIAPALERPVTPARNENELGFIDDRASRPSFFLHRLESDELLPRHDLALDDPIDRAAVEQLVRALRRHARDVLEQQRLA